MANIEKFCENTEKTFKEAMDRDGVIRKYRRNI